MISVLSSDSMSSSCSSQLFIQGSNTKSTAGRFSCPFPSFSLLHRPGLEGQSSQIQLLWPHSCPKQKSISPGHCAPEKSSFSSLELLWDEGSNSLGRSGDLISALLIQILFLDAGEKRERERLERGAKLLLPRQGEDRELGQGSNPSRALFQALL